MVPDHSVVSRIRCSAADQLPMIILNGTAGYKAGHQTEVVLVGRTWFYLEKRWFWRRNSLCASLKIILHHFIQSSVGLSHF